MDPANARPEASLAAKLEFLRAQAAYAGATQAPTALETHMSWLFFVGEQVLKLKKPVRFPYLDFTTLAAREYYCREELRLNRRLAPDVYLGLLALQVVGRDFRLVPEQQVDDRACTVDWLVLMRRLPAHDMLPTRIAERRLVPADIDPLVALLAGFYRSAPRADATPEQYRERFQCEQAVNRGVLLQPQFDLRGAATALDRLDAALVHMAGPLRERSGAGHVVDGHGDLRPEHICMSTPPVVIDCLEFNAQLRQVDPFDELAFLALECEIAGAAWIGPQLHSGCARALGQAPPETLVQLYTAYRALLRARLAMAHLLEPAPRTPLLWPERAQRYVDRALRALDALQNS